MNTKRMKKRLFSGTALTVMVAMLATPLNTTAFAQDNQPQIDCSVAENVAQCVELGLIEPPAEPAPEQPAEQPVEAPVEPAPEQPAEQPAEAPVEPAPEQPAEQPAEAPTEPAPEQPVEQPAEAPAEPAPEQPVEQPVEAPAEPAPEQPTEQPVEAPAEPAPEQPVEAPAEPAPEQPAEQPAEAPAEPAPEQPAQEATEQPATEEQPTAVQLPEPVPPTAEEVQQSEELTEETGVQPLVAEPAAEPTVNEVQDTIVERGVQATVVPDTLSDQERAAIAEAEQQRRDEARDRRLELLGAAAVGVAIGAIIPQLGGRVVGDQGDRLIIERDGQYVVRKDESSLLRRGDVEFSVERLRNGLTRETVTRQNGVQIVTIRDAGGFLLTRTRVLPNGQEIILIDNREFDDSYIDWNDRLPPIRVDIPRDDYIVGTRGADRDRIYRTFLAPPVEQVDRAYSLRDVRENKRIRDMVRRVDLDTVTFDSGSATVTASQVPYLQDIARAAIALIAQDPDSILLVEGHTDAVGDEIYNLDLSDRRAETVAAILVERYGVPGENLVVQGYGEQFLKVDTQASERANRRVTIRNISPLLSAGK